MLAWMLAVYAKITKKCDGVGSGGRAQDLHYIKDKLNEYRRRVEEEPERDTAPSEDEDE